MDQIINNHTAVKDNQIILDDECYMDLLKAGLSSSQIDGLKDHLNKTNKQLREGEVTMGDLYREVPYFNSDDSDSRAILPCATTTGETKTVFAWFYIDFYMNSCDTQEFKYGLGAGVAIIAAAVTGGWGALLGYLPVATIDLMASKGNGGIIIRWFYWAGTWIILPQY
ncbi:MAG: hypothetical protein JW969_15270 [Spirochaetales bacterium]|nr:hypothetical protein [Spirochaetales bacterium]